MGTFLFNSPVTVAFLHVHVPKASRVQHEYFALSKYLENDLISVQVECSDEGIDNDNGESSSTSPRLYVVRPDGTASPLCAHEDDNPNDLYVDPRTDPFLDCNDDDVLRCYGEGWYGQRVVPSLGGGPGYGAEADDVWTIEEELLETLEEDGVILPILDLGIAHGEKARGGAI
eukprot:CAMPEP_0204635896 /NCGR_PEP_ID=MMETSP0717-20131115/32610_1 /ASSEMBLY_ACC=CAM_ASM_000666 /TAXON_ID=230516 /ORGANISM="Chaetoceros curvisetus" /LENGTH=172 /DNA_ID=CAMNT_0051654803 /DNA_START=83 /DNA_END=601 /DNA_ORIENTATION=+